MKNISDKQFYSKNKYTGDVIFIPVKQLYKYKAFDREKEYNQGINDDTLKKLLPDVMKNGMIDPVRFEMYNDKGLMTEGNHRLVIAKWLGLKYLPVDVVTLTEPWCTINKDKCVDIPIEGLELFSLKEI